MRHRLVRQRQLNQQIVDHTNQLRANQVQVAVARAVVTRNWLAQSKNLDLLLLASCSFLLALFCHSIIYTLLANPTSDRPVIEQVRLPLR